VCPQSLILSVGRASEPLIPAAGAFCCLASILKAFLLKRNSVSEINVDFLS
jgi:hypothetical protein